MRKIPAHWLISFPMVVIGSVFYRALASGWIQIENVWVNWTLRALALTLAIVGFCLFIMLGHLKRVKEAREREKDQTKR